MKLTCNREKLLHAFRTAASVAPAHSPKPILQNVKLEATSESVVLSATDLEVGIRIELPGVEVEIPGDVILPAGRFGSILRKNSDEKLLLESEAQRAQVKGDRSEFRLPWENPDNFPPVPGFDEEKYHEVPAQFFRKLARRTVFATDSENNRYALGGVLLEMGEKGITAVGTDGRRLAKQEGPAKSVGGHDTGESMTIVPSRAMQLIERALAENEANIQLAAREDDVLVKSDRTTIYTRLVEGRYPEWRSVFPCREGTRIEIQVGPLLSAIDQAAVVTNKEWHEEGHGVDFTFGAGKAVLAGREAGLGESHVEMPIAYDGTEITISLDPRYMADFLKVLDPETTFVLEVYDSETAAVGRTDDGYDYVIMPVAAGN